MEDLDFEEADALLTQDEIKRRDALLAGAEDEETIEAINALFERIAADREEHREAWEEKFSAARGGSAGAAAGGAAAPGSGKAKRKPAENLRQGWDDKRSAGDPLPPQRPPPAAEAAAAGAAAGAADAAGAEAAAAAAAAETAPPPSSDALTALAAATVFNVDPSTLTPEQFDAAFEAHCKERAQAEWEALQEVKDDDLLGSLMRCVWGRGGG